MVGEIEQAPRGFWSRFRARPVLIEKSQGLEYSTLPIPLETYIPMAGVAEKTPVMQMSWKFQRDMVYTSDLLALIVRTKTNETFRNGLSVTEKFKSKCTVCEREFEEEKVVCPFDGGEMKRPDYQQWIELTKFVGRKNRFGESLLTTMREIDTDVHIGDNGWVYLLRAYQFGDDGKMTAAQVEEVIRFDADKMRMIMSRYGMGATEMGTYTYFCVEHRQEMKEFGEPGDDYRCTCGKVLLPAWYMALTKAERMYYGPNEIYHVKVYSNAQGYGVSPLLAVYMKVNALLRMDRFILDAYSLQRSPQQLLILRGRADSIHRSWEYLMQKSRENPNMVYPLVIEGDDGGTNKRVVENVEMNLKPIEWNWTTMRDEYRNVVGAVYGVQPMFLQGSQSQAGGLSVRADTPIFVKHNGVFDIVPVASLHTDYMHNESTYGLKDYLVLDKEGEFTPILKSFRHKAEKEQFSVTTDAGFVEMSGDHSVYLANGEVVKGSELTVGSEVAVRESPVVVGTDSFSEEVAWALGLFAAEGTSWRRIGSGARVSISNTQKGLLERAKLALDNFFGAEGTYVLIESEGHLPCWRLEYNRVSAFEWFESYTYSQYEQRDYRLDSRMLVREKKVPVQVLNGSLAIAKAYYDGYYAGDGSQTEGERVNGVYMVLMAGIQYLMRKIGKNVTCYEVPERGNAQNQVRLSAIQKEVSLPGRVKTIRKQLIDTDWFDLETESHSFVGGIGGIVLHNSNEGLQIAVTTLAIKQGQGAWNGFLEFLSKQLGGTDYLFKLNPNEQEDEMRDLDLEVKRIGIAQSMMQMGYSIETHQDAKGRLMFTYKEKEPSEPSDIVPEDIDGKDLFPVSGARTLEEQRQEQIDEERRLETAPRPSREYGPGDVSAGMVKESGYREDRERTMRILAGGQPRCAVEGCGATPDDLMISHKAPDEFSSYGARSGGGNYARWMKYVREHLSNYQILCSRHHSQFDGRVVPPPSVHRKGVDKTNYESKPRKIRKLPRGDETTSMVIVEPTQSMQLLGGPGGDVG